MRSTGLLGALILVYTASCTSLAAPASIQSPDIPADMKPTGGPTRDDASFNRKIGSNLRTLLADDQSGKDVQRAARDLGLRLSIKKEVLLDIYVTNHAQQAAARFTALGMTVQSVSENGGIVEGLLPLNAVPAVARLDFVKALLPVMAFGTDRAP